MALQLTKEQEIASNPECSVWVTANAGTGKTKILSDRVLRIMLGKTPINKILCLTYTTAGVSEMYNRIIKRLSHWAICCDDELLEEIKALTNIEPHRNTLSYARTLFTKVIDDPESLKIQTIHGFCQSMLKKFPLEAKINPHFTVLDDQTEKQLLKESWIRLLTSNQDKDLTEAVKKLSLVVAEVTFNDVIKDLINKREQLLYIEKTYGTVDNALLKLYTLFNVKPDLSEEDVLKEIVQYVPEDITYLADMLASSQNNNEVNRAKILHDWLKLDLDSRIKELGKYKKIFFTKAGNKPCAQRSIITIPTIKNAPELPNVIAAEQERLMNLFDRLNSLKIIQHTRLLLTIGQKIISVYKKIKDHRGLIDYNDLIFYANRLLSDPSIAPWVMYKLDEGIDHILVDEAQDTSPAQWEIVERLCEEFFSGADETEKRDRSLFVVGDEKQSIFSFQGADPDKFGQMRQLFEKKAKESMHKWEQVSLGLSFRSTSPVLNSTDSVFANDIHRQAITKIESKIKHLTHRNNDAGLVELWPLIKADIQKSNRLKMPVCYEKNQKSATLLAEKIAGKIANWIESKHLLKTRNRPIEAGDIMVLIRNRTGDFCHSLVKQLEARNIQVAGIDRMKLKEHICIMDLIALGKFMLLPGDDLNFATLLKSPIFGLDEDDIYHLAYGRESQSIWQVMLQKQDDEHFKEHVKFIQNILAKVNFIAPFEFYSYVIDACGIRKKFIQRMGLEVNDPIDEFLNIIMDYEKDNVSTLQGFINWLEKGDAEVKRDMAQSKGEVRILTVHSAKGLQAPIVFLPDTTSLPSSNKDHILSWNNILIWPGRRGHYNIFCEEILKGNKTMQYEEYLRLLYVAMTRAEDELYVCGHSDQAVNSDTWYSLVKQGLERQNPQKISVFDKEDGLRVDNHQDTTKTQDHIPSMAQDVQPAQVKLPEFITSLPEKEHQENIYITPSAQGNNAIISCSPIENPLLFQRGNLIHLLLEVLPDVEPENRLEVANSLAKNHPKDMAENAVEEVFSVINHPDFSALFSTNSVAEVPICGKIGNKVINGQVDRLVVEEEKVMIIDYKTNQKPPKSRENIPEHYAAQLLSYYKILEQIYPNKTIECFLLWTYDLSMMQVDVPH